MTDNILLKGGTASYTCWGCLLLTTLNPLSVVYDTNKFKFSHSDWNFMCQRCEFSAKRIHQLLKTTGMGDGNHFLSARNILTLLRISVILLFPICWEVEGTDIAKNVRCCIEVVLQNHVRMKREATSNLSCRYCHLHCLYSEVVFLTSRVDMAQEALRGTQGVHTRRRLSVACWGRTQAHLCRRACCRANPDGTSQAATW